jgi:hypothetical protein
VKAVGSPLPGQLIGAEVVTNIPVAVGLRPHPANVRIRSRKILGRPTRGATKKKELLDRM